MGVGDGVCVGKDFGVGTGADVIFGLDAGADACCTVGTDVGVTFDKVLVNVCWAPLRLAIEFFVELKPRDDKSGSKTIMAIISIQAVKIIGHFQEC